MSNYQQREKVENLFAELERLKVTNQTLSERTTETAKIIEVSRELLKLNDRESIIDFTLRRFSLAENFPYVAFCKVSEEGKAKITREYTSLPIEGNALSEFSIGRSLIKKLFSEEGLFIRKISDGNDEIKFKLNFNDFTPAYALAIAVDFSGTKEFFFFVTSRNDLSRLRKKIIAIQSALDLIKLRIENIYLTENLEKKNKLLEARIKKTNGAYAWDKSLNEILIDVSPHALVVTRAEDHVIVEVNKAFLRITGLPKESILGENFIDADIWENESEREKLKKEILSGSRFENFKAMIKSIRSTSSFISISSYDFSVSEVNYKLYVLADITRLKSMSEKLFHAEQKYFRVFNDALAGILLLDNNGIIIEANKKMIDLTGYEKEEMLNQHITNFFTKEELKVKPAQYSVLQIGQEISMERELLRKDGALVPVEIRAKKTEANEIQIFFRDLTEIKKAEKEIRDNEEKYRKLISLSPIGMLIVQEGKIVFSNDALAKTLGYEKAEDIIGKEIFSFIHPDYLQSAKERMENLFAGEKSVNGQEEIFVRQDDTLVNVLIYAQHIKYEGKPAVQGYIYDITEIRKSEELIKLAQKKAEAADKLKTEFIAQVSHEMRTPLNIIFNYLALLEEEMDEDFKEKHEMELETIKKGSRRLERTVDLILNVTEMELNYYSPKIREFDLHDDVLFNVYYTYKEKAEKKGIKISLKKNTKNTLLKSDFNAVNKIAEQLIDNAVKFTNEGSVNIVVGRDNLNRLYFEVSDTGIGIKKEFLNKIFTPFSQESEGSTRQYQGLGLGLTLVKKYCEIIGAEISTNTEKDKGTTFKILFNQQEF